MKNIIGIDPGIKGALALMDDQYNVLDVVDMPSMVERVVNGKAKRCINYKNLQLILSAWCAEYGELEAWMEDVHSMPSMNSVAVFSFGSNVGAIKAVVSNEDIKINYVSPQQWKKNFEIKMSSKMDKKEKKQTSIDYVIGLYPSMCDIIGKSSDRAEAILIAKYGVKKYRGE